ncbi:MAG: hypothetical protein Kow0098_17480 [Ignavibacteriaceae bacterium]
MKNLSLLFFLFILLNLNTYAQFTEFHPELDWYTIKGEHCQVHFHPGAERTAKVVAKICDEVWGPITSLYQYEPEEVHFVIKDIDDYSNGATYFFDNKIEIWASALDFDLRGQHNWLRNVISHEFTHLVQIQASMKLTRNLPAFFLQVLNYEDERRPDILYGFPNVIVSYPLATINVPAWFAEGTAQYMRKEFDYDNWDSHRDMILRCYALDNKMLSWNEMGVFGKTSLGNESVYNSGFALTRYIAQKYGEDKLRKISENLGNLTTFTIDAAIEDALGIDGRTLYNEWKNFLTEDYRKRTAKVIENTIAGDTIRQEGFGNFYPVFSQNGEKIFYISNKSADYFSNSAVYRFDPETGEEQMLVAGVRSTLDYVPGTDKIIYSRLSEDNPGWVNVHDLYSFDTETNEEKRLTFNLRANHPDVSNNGDLIAFVFQKDGTANIGIVDINGKNFRQITFFENGEQVFNPGFSNDDSFIIFDFAYHQTRDIKKVDLNTLSVENVIVTENDERNPVFTSDDKIIYSSDKTGIFNLYRMDPLSGETTQLTNVPGGAFMADVDKDGNIVYAGYTSDGYKIFRINANEQQKVIDGYNYIAINNPPLQKDWSNGDITRFDINPLRNFNDRQLPDYEQEKYSGAFSQLSFFPFIRYDNYNPSNSFTEKLKPGVYVTSSDMLNRYSIFAGGSINSRLERDLFLLFDYRNKIPLIFDLGLKPEVALELYNISRKAEVDILFGEHVVNGNTEYDFIIPTEVTYNLFEVDLAAKHRLISRGNDLEFRFIFSQYTATLGSFILPDKTLYPTTNDTYLIGRNFRLTYTHEQLFPYKDSEINPIGMNLQLIYDYESNKFNEEGEYIVEDGLLKPKYKIFNFHRLELNSSLHFPLWMDHTVTAKLRGGSILGPKVPDFFDFYLGGLIGMKAYPFYAISGNEIAWFNLTYRFPLFRNIDFKLGHLYLDKIFFSIYGDFGNAWNGDIPDLKDFKKGAGFELRIQMNSYYLFPTNIFFNASYGFDKFERAIRNQIITYGKEWRFYGGILFGFDI